MDGSLASCRSRVVDEPQIEQRSTERILIYFTPDSGSSMRHAAAANERNSWHSIWREKMKLLLFSSCLAKPKNAIHSFHFKIESIPYIQNI